ncbi:hypothetical protein DQ04_04321040 [Trypanosoma grayi]|uniref:hypothetical protein n=1 Tax=Trypanosoma grayi TaxID=71804 RepID=UPI0004F44EBD|nr:hypothetical protein DQ04_04321040 [Trypanosoma grayi]KEG10000.1 hypothetical protein DQ04_04321040 [Trypanosoma grayi]
MSGSEIDTMRAGRQHAVFVLAAVLCSVCFCATAATEVKPLLKQAAKPGWRADGIPNSIHHVQVHKEGHADYTGKRALKAAEASVEHNASVVMLRDAVSSAEAVASSSLLAAEKAAKAAKQAEVAATESLYAAGNATSAATFAQYTMGTGTRIARKGSSDGQKKHFEVQAGRAEDLSETASESAARAASNSLAAAVEAKEALDMVTKILADAAIARQKATESNGNLENGLSDGMAAVRNADIAAKSAQSAATDAKRAVEESIKAAEKGRMASTKAKEAARTARSAIEGSSVDKTSHATSVARLFDESLDFAKQATSSAGAVQNYVDNALQSADRTKEEVSTATRAAAAANKHLKELNLTHPHENKESATVPAASIPRHEDSPGEQNNDEPTVGIHPADSANVQHDQPHGSTKGTATSQFTKFSETNSENLPSGTAKISATSDDANRPKESLLHRNVITDRSTNILCLRFLLLLLFGVLILIVAY